MKAMDLEHILKELDSDPETIRRYAATGLTTLDKCLGKDDEEGQLWATAVGCMGNALTVDFYHKTGEEMRGLLANELHRFDHEASGRVIAASILIAIGYLIDKKLLQVPKPILRYPQGDDPR